jgi:hypothetical protein
MCPAVFGDDGTPDVSAFLGRDAGIDALRARGGYDL